MPSLEELQRLTAAAMRLDDSSFRQLLDAAEKLAGRFPGPPAEVTYDQFCEAMAAGGVTPPRFRVLWSKVTKRGSHYGRFDSVPLELLVDKAIDKAPPLQIAPDTWNVFRHWVGTLSCE